MSDLNMLRSLFADKNLSEECKKTIEEKLKLKKKAKSFPPRDSQPNLEKEVSLKEKLNTKTPESILKFSDQFIYL